MDDILVSQVPEDQGIHVAHVRHLTNPDVRTPAQGPDTKRKYQRKQKEYAKLYNRGIATIKRAYRDQLPLDDPDAMAEIWVARSGRKKEQPPPARSEGECGVESPALILDNPIDLGEASLEGEGILAAIDRLRRVERHRAAAYFHSLLHNGNPNERRNLFQEWMGVIEALRKLAKDEPTIRKLNGLLIEVADIESIWSATLASFRAAAQNLPGSAADRIVGLTEYHEIRAILEEEIDVLLKALDTGAGADEQSPGTDARDNPASDAADPQAESLGVDRPEHAHPDHGGLEVPRPDPDRQDAAASGTVG